MPDIFHVWRPTQEVIDAARLAAATAPFSYEPVGGTRQDLPVGFEHDVQSVIVGRGDLAFARARLALLAGRAFDIPWVSLDRARFDVRPGAPLVHVSEQLCLFTVNACRIIYVVDDPGDFAFAWGTLAGHPVCGEERLGLCLSDNGDVVFEIRKFSRPAHVFVRLAGPVARRIQRRFTQDAFSALLAALR